jgi:hypothetical protein
MGFLSRRRKRADAKPPQPKTADDLIQEEFDRRDAPRLRAELVREQDFAILFNDASGIISTLKGMKERPGSKVEYDVERVDGDRHSERSLHITTNIPVSRHADSLFDHDDTLSIDVKLADDGFETSMIAWGDDEVHVSKGNNCHIIFLEDMDAGGIWREPERITQPGEIVDYAINHAIDAGLVKKKPKAPKAQP